MIYIYILNKVSALNMFLTTHQILKFNLIKFFIKFNILRMKKLNV